MRKMVENVCGSLYPSVTLAFPLPPTLLLSFKVTKNRLKVLFYT